MADEQELNIDGPDDYVPSGEHVESTDESYGSSKIKKSYSDISGQLGPDATDEDIISRLIESGQSGGMIPWESCLLPSRGMYYEGWSDGTIQVRAMNLAAEKILANKRLAASGQAIDYLFRECCRFPNGFDATQLLLGDRVFVLYFLRGITYGNLYEFALKCANEECGHVGTYEYDLNELASTITWGDPALGSEPFKVELPYATHITGRPVYVTVRFLRAADANNIVAKRRVKKKAISPGRVRTRNRDIADLNHEQDVYHQADDILSDNLEKMIVSVMSSTDPALVRPFIQNLHGEDSAAIREWSREHTPGIDTTVKVTCSQCGSEFNTGLPITETFFRPTNRRGVRSPA